MLFFIGLWGIILNRKNLIVILMSIELMLLAVNILFIAFSVAIDDIMGQVFALFVLTVAAAESSIGLAIIVVYYRIHGDIAVTNLHMLKG
jgi:NADH-quinone oxidoreductase subunit K